MRRAMAPAVALAMALAACGGGGGGNKAKPASPSADQATAATINLRQTDFPKGWTSAPHESTPQDAESAGQFAQCLGIPDPATRYPTDAHSPDFSMGQATTASSEVRMARTDADASADLSAFQSGKGTDCFKQTIEKLLPGRLPPGAKTSDLAVRQLEFPPLKDGTAAYQASLTVSLGGGLNVPVYVDLVAFQAGRAETVLNTLNTGSPFDPALEKDLAKKMADRA